MICIFCMQEKEGTLEHVFPYSIGGGLTNNRVCKDCNSDLGHSADDKLVNHLFVQINRNKFGIKGHSGQVPTLKKSLFKNARLKDNSDQKMRVSLEQDGPANITIVPLVRKSETKDGIQHSVHLDESQADQLPAMIKKIAQRSGVPDISKEDMEEHINTSKVENVLNPWIVSDFSIGLEDHVMGLLKIMYQMAHHWLGDEWLDDPIAELVRAALSNNSVDETKKIEMAANFGKDWPNPLKTEAHEHSATLLIDRESQIILYVTIFNCFYGTLVVTNNPDRYQRSNEDHIIAKTLRLDSTTRKYEFEEFPPPCKV